MLTLEFLSINALDNHSNYISCFSLHYSVFVTWWRKEWLLHICQWHVRYAQFEWMVYVVFNPRVGAQDVAEVAPVLIDWTSRVEDFGLTSSLLLFNLHFTKLLLRVHHRIPRTVLRVRLRCCCWSWPLTEIESLTHFVSTVNHLSWLILCEPLVIVCFVDVAERTPSFSCLLEVFTKQDIWLVAYEGCRWDLSCMQFSRP